MFAERVVVVSKSLCLRVLRMRQGTSALEAGVGHALLAFSMIVAVVPFLDSELVALTAAQVAVAAVPSFGTFDTPWGRALSVVAGDG